MFRLLLFVFLFTSVSLCTRSQNLDYELQHIRYSTQDGLPSNECYNVLQDRTGYIWISTDRGVSRYDGYAFETFTQEDGLTDVVVFRMHEDREGNIWMATYNKKICYFSPSGEFVEYQYNDVISATDLPISYAITLIHYDAEKSLHLQFSDYSYMKIDSLGNRSFSPHPTNVLSAIYTSDIDGIGTSIMIKDRMPPLLPELELLYHLDSSELIHSHLPHLTYRDTSYLYLYESCIKLHGESVKKYPVQYRYGFYKFSKGYIKNTIKYTNSTGKISLQRTPDFKEKGIPLLQDDLVTDVILDQEGNLWLSSLISGVYCIPNLNNQSLLPGINIKSILLSDEGMYLVGRRSDNYLLPKGENNLVKLKPNVMPFRALSESLGQFHITFYEKINRTIQDSFFSVYGIQKASDGNLYSWYRNSIYRIENGKRHIIYYELSAITTVFVQNENSIWVGQLDGLYKLHNGNIEPYHFSFGFIDSRIQDLHYQESEDVLLVATLGEGLFIIQGDTIVKQLNASNGLNTNTINQIFVDSNYVWLATNNGLQYWHKDWSKIDDVQVRTLPVHLNSPNVRQVCTTDSVLYLGTDSGLNIIDLKAFENRTAHFPLFIDELRINEEPRFFDDLQNLKHNENNLSFDFRGISFEQAYDLQYRYRLKGLSDAWTYTYNTSVPFISLPFGSFEFELEGRKKDGPWVQASNAVRFRILRPFWRTLWFQVLVGAIAIAILSTAFLLRIRNLKIQHQATRELISSEQKALSARLNPHFIYNALSRLQNLILKNERHQANDFVGKFSTLLRRVFEYSKEVFIPLSQDIEALKIYLELEALRSDVNFSFSVNTFDVDNADEIKVPSLLIQPIVENAIWHGQIYRIEDGHIDVSYHQKSKHLHISISDNGVGRKASQRSNLDRKVPDHRSGGLELIRKRLQLIEKATQQETSLAIIDLEKEDPQSQGTRVEITLPIIKKWL